MKEKPKSNMKLKPKSKSNSLKRSLSILKGGEEQLKNEEKEEEKEEKMEEEMMSKEGETNVTDSKINQPIQPIQLN